MATQAKDNGVESPLVILGSNPANVAAARASTVGAHRGPVPVGGAPLPTPDEKQLHRTPILHGYFVNDIPHVLNPTAGTIHEVSQEWVELARSEGMWEDQLPTSDRPDGGVSDTYISAAARLGKTRVPPLLENEFDDPSFFETFKSTIDHFSLIPTHQCNMRCTYCAYTGTYESKRAHEDVIINDEIIDRGAALIASLGSSAQKVDVVIFGGEALIQWKSVKCFHQKLRASIPKGKLFFFKIITNGVLLNKPSIVDYCIAHEIKLQVSLDGPEHVHDRYRPSAGGKPTFKAIIRNMETLFRRAPDYFRRHISVHATYSPPYLIDETDEWFRNQEMFASMGARERNFSAYHVNTVETTWFNDKAGYETALEGEWARLQERYIQGLTDDDYERIRFFPASVCEPEVALLGRRISYDRANPGHAAEWDRPDCLPGSQLAIDPRGDVYVCSQTTEFVPLGDVWQGLSEEALRSTRAAYLAKKNEGCRACWNYKYCNMCLATMTRGKVIHNKTYSVNCERTRLRTTKYLRLLTEVRQRAPERLPGIFEQWS